MSINLISTIFQMDFEKPIVKFVLIALADHQHDHKEDTIYPAISTIAKKCSISERSVYRALNDLEKLGYIERINRKSTKGDNISNLYKITLPYELKLVKKQSNTPDTVSVPPDTVSVPPLTQWHTNHNTESLIKSSLNTCEVEQIFDYWKLKSNHPKAKLDNKRKTKIEGALKNYSIEEIKQAIDGCLSSDYNRKNGFDDIELICRDSSKTDRYIKLFHNPQLGKDKKSSKHDGFMNAMRDAWSDEND